MPTHASLVTPVPAPPTIAAPRVSTMAQGLVGSEILKIAAEIRQRREAGARICNLTVGDFDPAQFPIPAALADAIRDAIATGETNYPPSAGMPALRAAISEYWARSLGLRYAPEQIVVTGGSRPGIYGAYVAVVDPGDRVVYPVPSWNNNHYCHLVGAQGVPLSCAPEAAFLPTRAQLEPLIRGARLIALNSPLNPTGTAFTADQLGDICDLVLEENARRGAGERPCYLLYDQVYWTLTFGDVRHVDPVSLRPAMAKYTIYVDGISKSLSATGVRVGWVAGPPDVTKAMSDILSHVGAWAPRAEQVATARVLADDAALDAFRTRFLEGVRRRLDLLHDAMATMRAEGLPVDAIPPMGAIYLSARFDLNGRRTRDGMRLRTNDDVRAYLLRAAGMAVVPFQAFGAREDTGWFRLSVGAASPEEIAEMLPRLRTAIAELH